MYFLSVLGVVLISGYLMLLTMGSLNFVSFIDFPSLLTILLFEVTILFSAGLLKDFNNAFRLVVRTKRNAESAVSASELRRAVEAVRLAGKVSLVGGAFALLVQIILILHHMSSPEKLGPMLAVAILTLLYALAIALLLLPLESKLRVKLGDMTEE